MSGKAARIVLSEKQDEILQSMIRSRTLSQRLAQGPVSFCGRLSVNRMKTLPRR